MGEVCLITDDTNLNYILLSQQINITDIHKSFASHLDKRKLRKKYPFNEQRTTSCLADENQPI